MLVIVISKNEEPQRCNLIPRKHCCLGDAKKVLLPRYSQSCQSILFVEETTLSLQRGDFKTHNSVL